MSDRSKSAPAVLSSDDLVVDLSDLAASVQRRWMSLSLVTFVGLLLGMVWGWRSGPVYEVVIVAVPTESDVMAGGNLLESAGLGLAGLIGFAPAGQITRKDESIAILKSRKFLYLFLNDLDIVREMYGDEDERWWRPPFWPRSEPTVADAYELFLSDVLSISEKRATGIIEISIRWSDPNLTAGWGRELIHRLNIEMQTRARERATKEIQFLQDELDRTESVQVRQAILKLVESQMKALMLANISEDFALRVIDPPITPDPDKPVNLSLFAKMLICGLIGLLLGLGVIVLRNARFSPKN